MVGAREGREARLGCVHALITNRLGNGVWLTGIEADEMLQKQSKLINPCRCWCFKHGGNEATALGTTRSTPPSFPSSSPSRSFAGQQQLFLQARVKTLNPHV